MILKYIPDAGDVLSISSINDHEFIPSLKPVVLVLSSCDYNKLTGQLLFVPCKTEPKNYPFEVSISSFELVCLADQINHFSFKSISYEKMGTITNEEFDIIKAKINALIL